MKKNNLIQILNEIVYIKDEKQRMIKTQNYADAATLRDREKELLNFLYNKGVIKSLDNINSNDIIKNIIDRMKNLCNWILNNKNNEIIKD